MAVKLREIQERFSKILFQDYGLERLYTVKDWIFSMDQLDVDETQEQYYWKDVDYSCQDRSKWSIKKHYERIQYMIVHGGTEKLLHDKQWNMLGCEGLLLCLVHWTILL